MSIDLQFRRATVDDLQWAVPLIYSAGPETFDYTFAHFGRDAQAFLEFAFALPDGLFSASQHHVVVLKRQVVAVGAAYPGSIYPRLSQETSSQIKRFYNRFRWLKIFRQSRHLHGLIPPPPFSSLYIADVGVSSSHQNLGIGTHIVTQSLRTSLLPPLQDCVLDVAESNIRARTFYERIGFTSIQRNRPHKPNTGVPNTLRMRLVATNAPN